MTQDHDLDALIRQRLRGLRLARGWSLEQLAARCFLSPSTLSRIETGQRRIGLDQLVLLARALGTSLDQLAAAADDADVVIRPEPVRSPGRTVWVLNRDAERTGSTVAKIRVTEEAPSGPEQARVHPGRDWFTVLSGTIRLELGERTILVPAGESAEFSTMVPHALFAHGGPAEMLTILDHHGERAHLRETAPPA